MEFYAFGKFRDLVIGDWRDGIGLEDVVGGIFGLDRLRCGFLEVVGLVFGEIGGYDGFLEN